MAKTKIKAMLGVIIALVIGGILIGTLLPVGINAVEQPNTINATQDEGEVVTLDDQLTANVTNVEPGSNATVELNDTSQSASGSTTSKVVNVGATESYDMPGGTVNVTVNSANSGSPDNAEMTYEVPNDFGWDQSSKDIFGLLPLFFVLVPLVIVAGWAMKSM